MYEKERDSMVEFQLVKRGIENKYLIEVMRLVPRHKFIPEVSRVMSYGDFAVPIGHGQTISQPIIVAQMVELLDPKKTDKILEVGTGSGYCTAILGRLSNKVISVEKITELAMKAKKTLKELKIDNVGVIVGDGSVGAVHYYPYDKIIVSAACPEIPNEFIEQLRLGGVIVAPIGDRMKQKMTKFVKTREGLKKTEHSSCSFMPLTGKNGFKL